jgi:hypothetical protein
MRVIAKRVGTKERVNLWKAIIEGAAIGTFDIVDLAMRINAGNKMNIGSIFQLARGGTDEVSVTDANGLVHEVFMDNGTLAPPDDEIDQSILVNLSDSYIAAWVNRHCKRGNDRDLACSIYRKLADAGLSPMRALLTGRGGGASNLTPVLQGTPVDLDLLKPLLLT